MIKIDLKQFIHDRVWFGFVYFRNTRDFLFLGWGMFFIPMRLRTQAPPKWYLKTFNIEYF